MACASPASVCVTTRPLRGIIRKIEEGTSFAETGIHLRCKYFMLINPSVRLCGSLFEHGRVPRCRKVFHPRSSSEEKASGWGIDLCSVAFLQHVSVCFLTRRFECLGLDQPHFVGISLAALSISSALTSCDSSATN